MYNEDSLIQGLAENLYMEGYDVVPELLGKKVKSVGQKIVSKIKRIKRKGGVSISTPGGSAQIGPASSPDPLPVPSIMDKIKEPKTLALVAGAGIVIFMISRKKRRGR